MKGRVVMNKRILSKALSIIIAAVYITASLCIDPAAGLQISLRTNQAGFREAVASFIDMRWLADRIRFIEEDTGDEPSADLGKVTSLGQVFLKKAFIDNQLDELGVAFEIRKKGQAIPLESIGAAIEGLSPQDALPELKDLLDEIRITINGALMLRYYNPAAVTDAPLRYGGHPGYVRARLRGARTADILHRGVLRADLSKGFGKSGPTRLGRC